MLKNPTTRSGCWNGWISPLIEIRFEAPIAETSAILVMLVESVHGDSSRFQHQQATAANAPTSTRVPRSLLL